MSLSVRPSVHLSVTRRYSVEAIKHHQTFSPSGSHAILVFHTKRYGNIPTGTRFQRRHRMQGYRFSIRCLALSRKWYKIQLRCRRAGCVHSTVHGCVSALPSRIPWSVKWTGQLPVMVNCSKTQRCTWDLIHLVMSLCWRWTRIPMRSPAKHYRLLSLNVATRINTMSPTSVSARPISDKHGGGCS